MSFEIDIVTVGPLAANCYFLTCPETKQTLIIDPGDNPQKIIDRIRKRDYRPQAIILTHGHPDHIGAVSAIRQELSLPVMIHEADRHMLAILGIADVERYLVADESLVLNKDKIMVIHTPGHTAGSVCLYHTPVLFSGDTLFKDGIGRTDLPGGSWIKMQQSLKNILFKLPPETKVYPGHGPVTTIGAEKNS